MSNPEDLPGEVPVQKGIYLYHFVDDLGLESGKKYYYQVKLWKDGPLEFSSYSENNSSEKQINSENSILEIYVPPKNMSFVHRWMVNKQQCTAIDKNIFHGKHLFEDVKLDNMLNFNPINHGFNLKTVRADKYLSPPVPNYDITNNYRCSYNGVGAYYDSEVDGYFYDIQKSYLVDRFETGVNIGSTSEEILDANPSDITDAAKKCFMDTVPMPCLSSDNASPFRSGQPLTLIKAKTGTILYHFGSYPRIFIQSAIPLDGTDNPQNGWTAVSNLNLKTSMLSNSAYLPPFILNDASIINNNCSRRVASLSDQELSGRLPSRNEFLVFAEFYEHLSGYDQVQIASKLDDNPSFTIGDNLNYSCHTVAGDLGWREDLIPDINKNNYPSTFYLSGAGSEIYGGWWNSYTMLKSGSYSNITTNKSSHLCMSKYGIQDMIGNLTELTGDWFKKDDNNEFYLDLDKTKDEHVRSLWKMSSWPTIREFGDISVSSEQIAIHNYFSTYLTAHSFASFKPVDSYNSATLFWNPISGLSFDRPAHRNPSLFTDPVFYEEGNQIRSSALFPTPENQNFVHDSDNFNFSSFTKGVNGVILDSINDGYPIILRDKGLYEEYNPFGYEFRDTVVKIGNENSDNATSLAVGGAGSNMAYSQYNTIYNDTPYTEHTNNDTRSMFSKFSTTPFNNDGVQNTGYRCIFPIDELRP